VHGRINVWDREKFFAGRGLVRLAESRASAWLAVGRASRVHGRARAPSKIF
jgi:hypothetical protein